MAQPKKVIYKFGSIVEGNATMRDLLGGKGAGLAEMVAVGVPVPPGFTITTDVCHVHLHSGTLPPEIGNEVRQAIHWLESETGKGFGNANSPLMVSVRSGAPVSMPGMMDTVLNVGLNDEVVTHWGRSLPSETFALDSYKRLVQMFGTIVLDIPRHLFEDEAARIRTVAGGGDVSAWTTVGLCDAIEAFKDVIQKHSGMPFPQDPQVQLSMAVEAVFRSWRSERARYYRKINHIEESMGTAVTVQAMVFGNQNEQSGTGVGFTRNPSTGAPGIFGEYLGNAQGEDIVAGIRTPTSIAELARQLPEVYAQLNGLVNRLERHFKEVQDFEFTVEDGKLYLLQTRSAKRSPLAAVRIATDMAKEGLITKAEAISRVSASSIPEILLPQLDLISADAHLLTSGLSASPGAVVGMIALTADIAISMKADGKQAILVTRETTADDIQGMDASVGFLTARGGATSHAAVVARGMGKCCITGASEVEVHIAKRTVRIGERTLAEGDYISMDGGTGRVFLGQLPMLPGTPQCAELELLMTWASAIPSCKVRANADSATDAKVAIDAGATGIGLCRTEHMFFEASRLKDVREMILAKTQEGRVVALKRLLPVQQADFEEMFRVMSTYPVTIRLLDPPLHEFLPSVSEIDAEIANAQRDEELDRGEMLRATRRQVELLTEVNPMMGHRGCRLSLSYPEILEMQVRAILRAAIQVTREGGKPLPEIMVPLVATQQEMARLAQMIHATATELFNNENQQVDYRIGTMIELPRAAICAGAISEHVDFISFGTNDLTQMTFGFSRDDARAYLDGYLEKGILKDDPFIRIDEEGVGYLVKMAIDSVRRINPKIKIGVCGEHGGDPQSIQFFHSLGVDYVSCSTARIPVALLAVAQAAISN